MPVSRQRSKLTLIASSCAVAYGDGFGAKVNVGAPKRIQGKLMPDALTLLRASSKDREQKSRRSVSCDRLCCSRCNKAKEKEDEGTIKE